MALQWVNTVGSGAGLRIGFFAGTGAVVEGLGAVGVLDWDAAGVSCTLAGGADLEVELRFRTVRMRLMYLDRPLSSPGWVGSC
jgi:hypothetical protein